jgi:predicted SnoaL-like aldol condensation-catalyzing enzyme
MYNLQKYFQFVIPGMVALTLMSCNQTSKFEERNKALVIKANEELIGKGNVSYADDVIDAEYSFPTYDEKGPALIKNFVTDLRTAFPDLQYKVDHVVAEGNMVSWRRTHEGTLQGDYMGHKATGKKVNWQEFIVARFTDDGRIAEEWGASDLETNMNNASGIEGEYEYLPPSKGRASVQNGQFVFLIGSADGSQPLHGEAGTYVIEGDRIRNTRIFSTNAKEVGTSFTWSVKSWSGDTLTYVVYNDKNESIGEGRSVRISN